MKSRMTSDEFRALIKGGAKIGGSKKLPTATSLGLNDGSSSGGEMLVSVVVNCRIPSLNHAYHTDRKTFRRFLTKEARAYKKLVKQHFIGRTIRKSKWYKIDIVFGFQLCGSDGEPVIRDTTNAIKLTEDAAFDALRVNDCRSKKLTIEKVDSTEEFIKITVEPMSGEK